MLKGLKRCLVIAAMCIIVSIAARVTIFAVDMPGSWAEPEIEKARFNYRKNKLWV